ncbi:PREDICTED: uncharacterized protein LOC107070967 [Polistes dominula]|uniref:Uncharacterized protein LOC107070967 n=1 Tax=Polistes dominula TaxID=743375 RepID=A0ABM1IXV0_POLDO|nr:PREDICTED: uncharacterized protein LOC107070967 [Polistes dominula]
MFSTKEKLIHRTGQNGVGRYDFLKLLINEFKSTSSKDAKQQVLANLANFAYDPINYDYLRQLKVIDLFLHILSEDNTTFVRFAIGGICNLCLDPINKAYILRNQGIPLVSLLLNSQDEGIILSSITTLMFLITPESKDDILSPTIVKHMQDFSNSTNTRIKNLICSLSLKVGDRVSISKTITNNDVLSFAQLTNDYNPIHITSDKNIVHGALLNGLVSGVLGTKLPGPGTIVTEQTLKYPNSCYVGDTVEIIVQIISFEMYLTFIFIILCVSTVYAKKDINENNNNHLNSSTSEEPVGCVCGVFLSGQFKKGSKEQPTGNPVILHEQSDSFPCTSHGNKQCINKCLEIIIKNLPNSSNILCAALDRDCLKEKASLFIQNCKNKWINTNLSSSKKYCCKDGISYKCPIN